MIERVVVRRGVYHDPVALMGASEEARAVAGVAHVAAGMVDPLNLVVIGSRHGYNLDNCGELTPNDLVIAVRADTEQAADRAIDVLEQHLDHRRGGREVLDVGPYVFAGERRGTDGIERVAWRQRTEPRPEPTLTRLEPHADRIAQANDTAVQRMQQARPVLVGVGTAGELLTDMARHTFLHAGPPIDWSSMSGPLRGAIIGAALYEGLADDPEDAIRKAKSGHFEFASGHERGALGPMSGVISYSMPLWVVHNDTHGNRAHATFSEGRDELLRFGAYNDAAVERLRWMRSVLFPVLAAALARLPAPLDLRALVANAVEMGDEVHNRNRAATSLLLRALAPALVNVDQPADAVADVAQFMDHDYFFLNLSMASAKATADAASGVENSTIVTTMARNGTEFGLRISGTGQRWFTAPSGRIDGLYVPGYTDADANPDMGDSTITETIGLGGFAMAAAPTITHFAGITVEDAVRATLTMYDITWTESVNYRIPALGYRGTPLGIDCRKVIEKGILPAFNTGIAHREAGVGHIGGGIVRPPIMPFMAACGAQPGTDSLHAARSVGTLESEADRKP